MRTFSLVICLIASLLLQTGCKLTLKKKSDPDAVTQTEETSVEAKTDSKSAKKKKPVPLFTEHDTKLITLYYSNEGNAQVLEDIVKQTAVSDKVAARLKTNEIIPKDVLVVPLPLELEKILSPQPAYDLRVQVGKHVIMMDIKSRRILDVIKLK